MFFLYLQRTWNDDDKAEEVVSQILENPTKSTKTLKSSDTNFFMVGRILFWVDFSHRGVSTEAQHFNKCGWPLHQLYLLGIYTRHLFNEQWRLQILGSENHIYIEYTNRYFPKSINTIDFNKENDVDDRNRVRVNNWVGDDWSTKEENCMARTECINFVYNEWR